jgi:hypothetical protein
LVFVAMEEERRQVVGSLVRERRISTADACVGIGGALAALVHLYAPWAVLFEIFSLVWPLRVFVTIFALFGIWNAVAAILLTRQIRRMS